MLTDIENTDGYGQKNTEVLDQKMVMAHVEMARKKQTDIVRKTQMDNWTWSENTVPHGQIQHRTSIGNTNGYAKRTQHAMIMDGC